MFYPRIYGSGSKGGGNLPNIQDDTLRAKSFITVVDLLSEGPIKGFVDSDSNLLVDLLLSKYPTVKDDGTLADDADFYPGTGKGYPASVTREIPMDGDGTGASFVYTTNAQGEVISVKVVSPGSGYSWIAPRPEPVIGKAVFFDEVPLQNNDLSYNFQNPRLYARYGYKDQTPIPYTYASSTVANGPVLVAVTQDYNFTVQGPFDAIAVAVSVDALYIRDMSTGDVSGTSVSYDVYVQREFDGNKLDPEVSDEVNRRLLYTDTIQGKASSKYVRSIQITLPKGVEAISYRWNFRIVRRTEDHTGSVEIADTLRFEAATGITYTPFSYPYSALVSIGLNAQQFPNIPIRSYAIRGLMVSIPDNYIPDAYLPCVTSDGAFWPSEDAPQYRQWVRSYNRHKTGRGAVVDSAGRALEQPWHGDFYTEWTNNPAWVFYDLATNTRYGMGDYVVSETGGVDRWELYKIARYCDEPVSDGYGGTEPRFVCNLVLQVAQDAFKVLNDLASIFRGMSYWAAGNIVPIQDRPFEAYRTFTNANAKNGVFSYSSSSRKARHSICNIRWNDPEDGYRVKVEVVENLEGIVRYGYRPLDLAPLGVTSRGQAKRIGESALFADIYEGAVITWRTSYEAIGLAPGDVVNVYDSSMSGVQYGGRVVKIEDSGTKITLDRLVEIPVEDENNPFTFVVVDPTATHTSEEVESSEDLISKRPSQLTSHRVALFEVDGNQRTVLTLSEPVTTGVVPGAIWGLETSTVSPQQVRIMSVEEIQTNEYEIIGLRYYPAKYSHIDFDTAFEDVSISAPSESTLRPKAVTDLVLTQQTTLVQGKEVHRISASWTPPANSYVETYEVWIRRGLGNFKITASTQFTEIELDLLSTGEYTIRVYALGIGGKRSPFTEAAITISEKFTATNEIISGLEAYFSNNLDEGNSTVFDFQDVGVSWRLNSQHNSYEIGSEPVGDAGGTSPNFQSYLVRVFDPNSDLVPLLEEETRSTTYILSLARNLSLTNGPYRDLIFEVRYKDTNGGYSAPAELRLTNPLPAKLNINDVVVSFFDSSDSGYAYVHLDLPVTTVTDSKGYRVWVKESSLGAINVNSDAPARINPQSNPVVLFLSRNKDYYLIVAEIDQFSVNSADCNPSDQTIISVPSAVPLGLIS